MNEEKELPSYYSIIPATVRYDKNLKANEKLMYGEITALASKNGFCWAENRYFAELYNVHKITISKWLKNLEDKGYIRTELKYVYGTKQVSKRYIYINDAPISEKTNTPINEKINTPISQNTKEELSTTSNNNTSNNKRATRSKLKFETHHLKLAELLYKQIQSNLPNFKEPNLEMWANEFRLIMERDKREGEEVQNLIIKSQSDDFWKKNILSPSKLRKQYDRLVIEFEGKNNFKSGNNIKSVDNALDYLKEL